MDAVERRKIRWAVVDAKPEGLLESLHATNRALCSATGADPGGRTRRAPPLKLEKICFLAYNRDFSHEIPQIFSRLPPLGAIFLRGGRMEQGLQM